MDRPPWLMTLHVEPHLQSPGTRLQRRAPRRPSPPARPQRPLSRACLCGQGRTVAAASAPLRCFHGRRCSRDGLVPRPRRGFRSPGPPSEWRLSAGMRVEQERCGSLQAGTAEWSAGTAELWVSRRADAAGRRGCWLQSRRTASLCWHETSTVQGERRLEGGGQTPRNSRALSGGVCRWLSAEFLQHVPRRIVFTQCMHAC